MTKGKYHIPVLLEESIAGLTLHPRGTYIDLTFGGGGHSRKILSFLDQGRLIAFDQDPDVKGHLIQDERFLFVNHNFRYMQNFLDYHSVGQVDGVLADLGVSSHQIDEPERGFSYRFDAPLDMRMSQGVSESAREIINEADRKRLTRIFRDYGEITRAGYWADHIIRERASSSIDRTSQLVECMMPLLKKGKENKDLSRLFQALRIEVNQEMDGLKRMLEQCVTWIKTGGRLAILSYHSIEDRLVKNFINTGNVEGIVSKDFFGNKQVPFLAVNRKLILPGDDELERNPRSRSAKLRIAERVLDEKE
jgi:16S rRNA (cytosine1402-N4)-methyltransferase